MRQSTLMRACTTGWAAFSAGPATSLAVCRPAFTYGATVSAASFTTGVAWLSACARRQMHPWGCNDGRLTAALSVSQGCSCCTQCKDSICWRGPSSCTIDARADVARPGERTFLAYSRPTVAVSTPALTLLPAACNTNKLVKKYALHLYCAQRHISTQQQFSSTVHANKAARL